MEIANNTFIVTGGASGLGEATTRAIVTAGGNVLIADMNAEKANELVAELGSAVQFSSTNVTDDADCAAAVAAAKAMPGNIAGLVCCAGVGVPQKVLGRDGVISSGDFMKVINVNLLGTFNMIRLTAEAMSTQPANDGNERGVIINTASVAAFDGQIGQPAYAASKAAVVGMTLPLAREFSRFGIRVMTIAPGLFLTPMMAQLPEEAQQSLGAQVPFPPRLGEPSEFAQLVQQIVENPMLNGETIRLDGAIRMTPK
mgnify:CR=1 FL=1